MSQYDTQALNDAFNNIQKQSPDWLKALREQAFAAFNSQGLPNRKVEAWKYTPVTAWKCLEPNTTTDTSIPKSIIEKAPSLEAYQINIINGLFCEATSGKLPEGVTINHVDYTNSKQETILKANFNKYVDYKQQPFAALNNALATSGIYLQIADNVQLDKPIQIIQYTNTSKPEVCYSRNFIMVGENSTAEIIINSFSDNTCFANNLTEFHLSPSSQLCVYRLNEEQSDYHGLCNNYFNMQSASILNYASFDIGTGWQRSSCQFDLHEKSQANLNGLFYGSEKQHIDNQICLNHLTANAESNTNFKGILDDQSKGVFNGRILVSEGAGQTIAHLQNKNVLLNQKAEMNTKPELEIYADDIQCSHGATVGQLDEELLFYLRSRGISKRNALAMLLKGFAEDVITKIKFEPLSEHIKQRFFAVAELEGANDGI